MAWAKWTRCGLYERGRGKMGEVNEIDELDDLDELDTKLDWTN